MARKKRTKGIVLTETLKSKARQVLEVAFAKDIAEGDTHSNILDEWRNHINTVRSLSTKTATVFLGTALLARAALGRDVDLFSIKAGEEANSYSIRSLSEYVLVPFSVEKGLDLRATGPQPLNNQPYFRYDRLDSSMRVRNKEDLSTLIYIIDKAQKLTEDEALIALSVFLKIALDSRSSLEGTLLFEGAGEITNISSIASLLNTVEGFLKENPEEGRRGQAFVAAAFDMVYSVVETSKVNDPSHKYPGDIRVFQTKGLEKPTLLAEVRQKSVSESDVLIFAQRVATSGIHRAYLLDLTAAIPGVKFSSEALKKHGVVLLEVQGFTLFFLILLQQVTTPLSQALERFVESSFVRLKELEVKEDTLNLWKQQLKQFFVSENRGMA